MKLHTALTIAGTDPSGGAGIMADLKSFQSRHVYGMAVVTSVVAQNTTGVHHVEHLSLESIDRQLHDVYSDIEPQAVKTGMIALPEKRADMAGERTLWNCLGGLAGTLVEQ